MAFLDDLKTLINQRGGVTLSKIGISTQKNWPDPIPSDGFMLLVKYGGMSPERTQQDVAVGKPAFQRPRAQIRVRAPEFQTAENLAYEAYNALVTVRNLIPSGGVYYREIDAIQEPYDDGPDGNGNAQVVFNVRAIKNPS